MRECRKCGQSIPRKINIDGKERNLQNRKFCLDCSPWRNHNTKPDDPQRKAKRFGGYSEWSDGEKRKNIATVLRRGQNRKKTLINLAGGACVKCGYDKCSRALTFHHRDRDSKKFGLCMNNLWSKRWDVIMEEYEKCELLCMNCHAESESAFEESKPLKE